MAWAITATVILFMAMGGISVVTAQQWLASDADTPTTIEVAADDYPVYDEIVRAKFLTSDTTLVLIERMTTTHMLPEPPTPASRSFFEAREFFDGRLPADLVGDFIAKNRQAARLGHFFAFGIPYQFLSRDGQPESEARDGGPRGRVVMLVQEGSALNRLAFSRVGFSPRRDRALVYVANERPDGSGVGFLIWLEVGNTGWQISETEVVWTAQPESGVAAGF